MTNQSNSPDGKPRKDEDRPSPDVGQEADGQVAAGSGSAQSRQHEYRSDGPGKVGLGSEGEEDLVAPDGVNQRNHGAADDAPGSGGQLSFEDEELTGRGEKARAGGTWRAEGADSGKLGPPREIMSDRNGPSDPERGPGSKRS